jgi:hypothetical protein
LLTVKQVGLNAPTADGAEHHREVTGCAGLNRQAPQRRHIEIRRTGAIVGRRRDLQLQNPALVTVKIFVATRHRTSGAKTAPLTSIADASTYS